MKFDLTGKRIGVIGSDGMVGQALVRRLANERCEVVTCGRRDVDLRLQDDVLNWFMTNRPQAVIIAAGTVGGILANSTRPAEFLYDNLAIQMNCIEVAWLASVKKVVILGSSCIYPRDAEQPIREESLLTGPLEPTNEAYAIAKIAAIKMGQAYRKQYGLDCISVMPCNLYGPGDNYDLESSHVVAALIRKAHEAKVIGGTMTIWGSGDPVRELMYVDDCADAIVFLLKNYSGDSPINVGTGSCIAIWSLARKIASVVGFCGRIGFDKSKPDGAPHKRLDVSRLTALGWRPKIRLEDGLRRAYAAFLSHPPHPRP